jgi:hypothetical protein
MGLRGGELMDGKTAGMIRAPACLYSDSSKRRAGQAGSDQLNQCKNVNEEVSVTFTRCSPGLPSNL